MKHLNLFYVAVLLVGGLLLYLFGGQPEETLSFYGFAESNETEINYNYPVVVQEILVQAGERVDSAQLLLRVRRRRSKEQLADQEFRIRELRDEERSWAEGKRRDLAELNQRTEQRLAALDARLTAKRRELAFRRDVSRELTSVELAPSGTTDIETDIATLEREREEILATAALRSEGIEEEIRLGVNPYRSRIERLRAEAIFKEGLREEEILVRAPAEGLIGSVDCKEQEYISAYDRLLSFYEPHSSVIKGYVHESLTLGVAIGDRFTVRSLKDETLSYPGRVIGLGSRIVEIPPRLRKVADVRTYGREVIVEIPPDNAFLQKEKVSLLHENLAR